MCLRLVNSAGVRDAHCTPLWCNPGITYEYELTSLWEVLSPPFSLDFEIENKLQKKWNSKRYNVNFLYYINFVHLIKKKCTFHYYTLSGNKNRFHYLLTTYLTHSIQMLRFKFNTFISYYLYILLFLFIKFQTLSLLPQDCFFFFFSIHFITIWEVDLQRIHSI